jgi:hypothetical protein
MPDWILFLAVVLLSAGVCHLNYRLGVSAGKRAIRRLVELEYRKEIDALQAACMYYRRRSMDLEAVIPPSYRPDTPGRN